MGHALFLARESRWGAWLLVTWAEPDQGVIGAGAQWGLQEEVGAQELPSHDNSPALPFVNGWRKTPSRFLSMDLTQMLSLHSYLAQKHWSKSVGNEIGM